jgi:hypothetical protein
MNKNKQNRKMIENETLVPLPNEDKWYTYGHYLKATEDEVENFLSQKKKIKLPEKTIDKIKRFSDENFWKLVPRLISAELDPEGTSRFVKFNPEIKE